MGRRLQNLRRRTKRFTDFKSWGDFERLKYFGEGIASSLRIFFVPKQSAATEEFEQVAQRLNLSPEALLLRQRQFLLMAIIFSLIAIATFIYAIYLFVDHGYLGGVVSLGVMLIALSVAFRNHFWFFQIKQRKLGCTFHEWFNIGLLGRRS